MEQQTQSRYANEQGEGQVGIEVDQQQYADQAVRPGSTEREAQRGHDGERQNEHA